MNCQYALLAQQPLVLAHLEQYRVIEIIGTDAEKYLQGQLTCDVTKLAPSESTLTAHCDPKGKTNTIFRLIRVAETQFYALMRAELVEKGLADLKKYAVFSKVTFTPVDALIIGVAGTEAKAYLSDNFKDYIVAEFDNRFIAVDPNNSNPHFIDLAQPLAQEAWDLIDIQQGYPVLNSAMQNEFLPQALNVQLLERAISFQKGCYIGQEMVARAKYRGANKRAMFTLVGKSDLAPPIGSEVEMLLETGWRKTGTIISAVCFDRVLWLQVVLNKDIESNTQFRLPADESHLCLHRLPYTLE